jgi:hypothetical protein
MKQTGTDMTYRVANASRRLAAGALLAAGMLLAGMATTTQAGITATGGTVTNYGPVNGTNWTAHIFTSTAWNVTSTTNFNVTAASPGDWAEVLVVGGAGGGSRGDSTGGASGGGGGGEVYYTNYFAITQGTYTVIVGAGGKGGTGDGAGASGTNSVFTNATFGVGRIARGGGLGGDSDAPAAAKTGGSGGGGAGRAGSTSGAAKTAVAPGLGNNGGNGDSTSKLAGGGGGAGSAGGAATSSNAGDGGAGFTNSISGSQAVYGCGGGGGGTNTSNGGIGGSGVGGNGGDTDTVATPGGANTGSGGGGGAKTSDNTYRPGTNGAAGIVIVRYVTPPSITVVTNTPPYGSFGSKEINTTSTWSYTVSGSVLSGDITVSVPSSAFTISTNNVDFGNTYTLAQTGGAVPATTIYVHFVPMGVGTYSATITNSSAGASDKLVTLNGEGFNPSVPTLMVTPPSLGFGNVITNKPSTNLMFTVTGSSLTDNVTVTAPSAYFKVSSNGTDFVSSFSLTTNAPGTLSATTIYVQFTPSNGSGPYAGNITNSTAGGADKTVALTGAGVVPGISVGAASLSFGYVPTNTTSTVTYTVSGSNLQADVTLNVSASGFTIKTNNGSFGSSVILAVPNKTEPAGGTLSDQTITVQFAPTVVQSYSAPITASSAGAANQTTTLGGNGAEQQIGVQQPAGTPLADGTTVDFGSTAGTVKTFVVTNSGGITLTLADITKDGAHSNDFTVGGTLPTSLAAGASTNFTVTFNPTALGARSAGLHIASGAAAGSFDITLTGTGAADPFLAFGGDSRTIITNNGIVYGIHKFTNVASAVFTPIKRLDAEVLVVAGGGGGCGGDNSNDGGGGGGGAGGLIYTNLTLAISDYTVTVGRGGNGTLPNGGASGKGSNSTFGALIALGGGGSRRDAVNPSDADDGGSGGGAYGRSFGTAGTAQQPGSVSGGYGNDGGLATGDVAGSNPGGGGGGAGSTGYAGSASSKNGGNGGSGYATDISGESKSYAGGGGGGACTSGTGGTTTAGGGAGGGPTSAGTSATGNTGGGGGGAGANAGNGLPGGAGGSGIVIVRYAIIPPRGTLILLR